MLARELKTEMKSEVHRRKMLEGKSLSLVFVSGFYGAGKTAVIKQALGDVRNQSVRTLVLVNSSHQQSADIDVYVLQSECAARGLANVTVRSFITPVPLSDPRGFPLLAKEVSELAASALYDYLIVETAGETDPIALAQAFEAPQAAANSQKLSDLARLDALVTVVSCTGFFDAYEASDPALRELHRQQLSFADLIVLSKPDGLGLNQNTISEIEKEIKEKANKSARVIVAKHGSLGEEHNILFTGLYSVKKAAKHDAWETQRSPLQPVCTHMWSFFTQTPFHAARLRKILYSRAGELVSNTRIKGLLWIAAPGKYNRFGLWSHTPVDSGTPVAAGTNWIADVAPSQWTDQEKQAVESWSSEVGDRQQLIAFMSDKPINEVMLKRLLEACLVKPTDGVRMELTAISRNDDQAAIRIDFPAGYVDEFESWPPVRPRKPLHLKELNSLDVFVKSLNETLTNLKNMLSGLALRALDAIGKPQDEERVRQEMRGGAMETYKLVVVVVKPFVDANMWRKGLAQRLSNLEERTQETQKAILVVVRNTKALLAHEITESEYRETAKEVAEMMQKSMTGLVSLAVQLYKAIRIAEEKRKETEAKVTMSVSTLASSLDTVEVAVDMGDKFVFDEATKECVASATHLSVEAGKLQLLEHQLSLQELLLDFVQKGKELDFSPPAPPPPPGQDFYADLNLDAAKRTDDELKDSQDKHKTKSFFTLRGSKDNVSTEPSTMRQAKVSRWKTARKKLNEAAKHSVDAIYQKLKSEEVLDYSVEGSTADLNVARDDVEEDAVPRARSQPVARFSDRMEHVIMELQRAVLAFIPAAQNYALSASADKAALFAQSKTDLFSWVKSATVMTFGTLIRAEDLDFPGTTLTPDAMGKILGTAIAALDKYSNTRGQVNESAITAAREAGGTQALQVEELLWEQIADESSKTSTIILQMLSALKVIKVASTPEQATVLYLPATVVTLCSTIQRLQDLVETAALLSLRSKWADAQEGGHFGRVRRSIMDGKDKVTKGDAAASAGQKDAKAQGQVELQEDVGMWDSNSMEGGLIFEKAAAELRQSEDPDKKAGAGSLSRVVRAASLNKLVELLTSDEEHDPRFIPMLLTTYRSFTTPQRLLKKLRERYNVPSSAGLPMERVERIQFRVCVVLKHWLEWQLFDFDKDLIAELSEFIDQLSQHSNKTIRFTADALRRSCEIKSRQSRKIDILRELKPPAVLSFSKMFLELKSVEVAEQMTLIDFNMFKSIRPQELLSGAWNKEPLKYRAHHVINLINRANSVSLWVAGMILLQPTSKTRRKMFSKFAVVAAQLRQVHNYHSLMAIISGLNLSAVSRLKTVKEDKANKVVNQLEDLMNPEASFKKYRDALQSAAPPTIPFVGVYLSDLTFMEDGNSDTLEGLININKRRMVYNIIESVQQYQLTGYTFEKREPLYTFLAELPVLSEADLFTLSLAREPREKPVTGKTIRGTTISTPAAINTTMPSGKTAASMPEPTLKDAASRDYKTMRYGSTSTTEQKQSQLNSPPITSASVPNLKRVMNPHQSDALLKNANAAFPTRSGLSASASAAASPSSPPAATTPNLGSQLLQRGTMPSRSISLPPDEPETNGPRRAFALASSAPSSPVNPSSPTACPKLAQRRPPPTPPTATSPATSAPPEVVNLSSPPARVASASALASPPPRPSRTTSPSFISYPPRRSPNDTS